MLEKSPLNWGYSRSMVVSAHIAHLSASTAYGGGEEHLRVLLAGLAQRGWRVTLVCPPASPLRPALATSGIIFRNWGPFGAADRSAPWELLSWSRRERIDLFHSHNPLEDLSAAAVRLAGEPPRAVTTIHDRVVMDGQGRRRRDMHARLYRQVLRRGFDAILAVSEATRRDVLTFAGLAPHRVRAIVNGTDFARLDAAPERLAARRALGLPAEAFVFSMGARVETLEHRKKGVTEFLAASLKILAALPQACACVVGLGRRAREEALGILAGRPEAARVLLEPFRSDFPVVLAACDVFVLPSLYEGLSRGLIEAMGMGRPVVATAVDGTVEALPAAAGLLVPPADSGALAGAVLTLAKDPMRCARMGEAGRVHARSRYGASHMTDQIEKIYRELLA